MIMDNEYNYYNPEEHQKEETFQNDNVEESTYSYSQGTDGGGTYGSFHYVPPKYETVKQKKKVPKMVKVLVMAVVFGLVSGSVFFGVNVIGNKLFGDDITPNETVSPSKVVNNAVLTQSSSVVTSLSLIHI